MANVNSVSNSNAYSSSIYGNKNILSGLASGLDTEAMIENSVSGYQTKIAQLQQKQTKLEWKQDAYRSITDKMVALSQKYTSYTSKTNLGSNGFFTNAVTTSVSGDNADKVSATGKATSDVQINSVSRLATAAKYTVDVGALNYADAMGADGKDFDWNLSFGTLSGSMSLRLGSETVDLKFDKNDVYASVDELVEGINAKLSELGDSGTAAAGLLKAERSGDTIKFTTSNDKGDSVYISSVSGNLKDLLGVKTPTSSAAKDRFDYNSFTVDDTSALKTNTTLTNYLKDKTLEVTLDGVTKKISFGDLSGKTVKVGDRDVRVGNLTRAQLNDTAVKSQLNGLLAENLQTGLDKAFGTDRVTASVNDNGGLSFAVDESTRSTLKVSSSVGDVLGLGTGGVTNYMNTTRTLGELLGDDFFKVKGTGEAVRNEDGTYSDAKGNRVDRDGYRLDSDGKSYLYEEQDLIINGESVGKFDRDSALESVLLAINNSADAGVSVNYSNLTGEFSFTAQETGAHSAIEFGDGLASRLFEVENSPERTLGDVFGDSIKWDEDGNATLRFDNDGFGAAVATLNKSDSLQALLDAMGQRFAPVTYDKDSGSYTVWRDANKTAAMTDEQTANMRIFSEDGEGLYFDEIFSGSGSKYTEGTDARINVTVNGKTMDLTRSSNAVSLDGLNVTLKGTFDTGEDGEAVSFKTSSNADTIVDAVRSFVNDLNSIISEIHDAYATQPLEKSTSTHTKYEPLTENDKEGMSESTIAAYEEKAKQGLLFGDTDLSALYSSLRSIITSSGLDKEAMKNIGLTTTYSSGVTTLSLDEDKLRSALDSDPDAVRNVFAKTKEGGSATNGLMASLKATLDAYSSTSIATPGILVRKAGTRLSSLSLLDNTVQKQIDNVSDQITSWQSKLSTKIDYYTKQFTALEQMMSNMNNQSSMLSQMMGY